MKRIVKIIIFCLVVLAVAAGIYYSMTAPVSIPTTTVDAKTVELVISEQGVVSSESVVSIYPFAQGPLQRVNVSKGQTVRAGDVLCEIDPGALHLRMEELSGVIRGYEAQIRLERAQVNNTNVLTNERLNLQNTLIEQNERDLERTLEHLERVETLFELGVIPRSEVDAARDLVADRQSALAMSRQELSLIDAGRGIAGMTEYYQALIESTAVTIAILESEMKNYTVISPVAGVIARLPVNDSNIVSMTTPVAEITVPEEAIIEVFVSTQDIDNVRVGDSVDLVLNRRDGDIRFFGRISHIDSAAGIRLSALGVEERRVKVQIVPDTSSVQGVDLGNGFDVGVRFILYREENKLAVPRTALFSDGNIDIIWVVRDGTARMVEVTLGMKLRTEIVVEEGLVAGDVVITDANNSALKNGVAIRG